MVWDPNNICHSMWTRSLMPFAGQSAIWSTLPFRTSSTEVVLYPRDCQTPDVKIKNKIRRAFSPGPAFRCRNLAPGWSEPHSPASSFWLLCALLGIAEPLQQLIIPSHASLGSCWEIPAVCDIVKVPICLDAQFLRVRPRKVKFSE